MIPHKVVIGLPWYSGPDIDTFPTYFELLHYLGRVRERSLWFAELERIKTEVSLPEGVEFRLPGLDGFNEFGDMELAELKPEDGVFEFYIAVETKMSLPGLARERIVDMALGVGADWIFMWDWDMRFSLATFLRLWRHQKPVVNALAVTSRDPVQPCLYTINQGVDPATGGTVFTSKTVFDFPTDHLLSDEDVGGALAFGAGVILINVNVFRQMPKPWFSSTGCGEDWFFCVRCANNGIPRYCDPTIFVQHKKHRADWYTKETYDRARREQPELYAELEKGGIPR